MSRRFLPSEAVSVEIKKNIHTMKIQFSRFEIYNFVIFIGPSEVITISLSMSGKYKFLIKNSIEEWGVLYNKDGNV